MKRKPPNADHATMYFVDALTRMRPDEKTGTRWGEAMVHAEVEAMRLANMDAAQRSARLNSSAVGWFARGYRFYLMPTATDAPASLVSLRGHQSPSPQKMAQHQARTMAQEAGEMWRRGQSATSIFAEAEREKAKEMPLPVHTPSPPKAPKQNVGDRRNPRPLLTAIKSVSDAPELPAPLHQLLTKPRSSDCLTNTPSESMRDTLRDMLTENRVLRVVGEPEALHAPGARVQPSDGTAAARPGHRLGPRQEDRRQQAKRSRPGADQLWHLQRHLAHGAESNGRARHVSHRSAPVVCRPQGGCCAPRSPPAGG